MKSALILGASRDQLNIGAAVRNRLAADPDWTAKGHDCALQAHSDVTIYDVPNLDWASFDALVVSLGATAIEPFAWTTDDQIEKVITACLTLPLRCARRYVEERSEYGGQIILVGSYAYRHPFSNGTAYCAAKAGLDMAGQTLAWELAPDFNVNVVHPYHVEGTPMWEEVQQGVRETKEMTREEADAYAKKDLRQPELSRPEDIAESITWLLSRNDPWMNGSSVELFGGTR
jgi:NAD(P)-dependent dehydrogenase (short-subunit alcohol dehydrogenase family)